MPHPAHAFKAGIRVDYRAPLSLARCPECGGWGEEARPRDEAGAPSFNWCPRCQLVWGVDAWPRPEG